MRVSSMDIAPGAPDELTADICIIGAGAAGLYLANRLSSKYRRIIVLEAGPAVATSATEVGFDCGFVAASYRGATEGRAFGLGGTTSLWGGKLAAFSNSDAVRENAVIAAAWQEILETCDAHADTVLRTLGLAVAQNADEVCMTPGSNPLDKTAALQSKDSCWLPFARRNLSWLRGDQDDDITTVYCDAVAAKWGLDQGPRGACRIRYVAAKSRSGRCMRVRAQQFVVAAGAIESTRILREVAAEGSNRILPAGAALGHYLSDHLSVSIAEFDTRSRRRVVDLFAPRFAHGCMWTCRFVEADPSPRTCRYFGHIMFATDNPGFELARSILQGFQRRRMPRLSTREVVEGAVGATRLAWNRWVRQRLHVPRYASCHLQIDMEQRPHYGNVIRLAHDKDAFGRAKSVIDWRVLAEDIEDLHVCSSSFLERWALYAPELAVHRNSAEQEALDKPHDAYHPVGTCRLGSDSEAVAGTDLKVRGTENLFVLSTAVFPSAGSANPTFNLLCFSEQLASKLAKQIP